MGRAGVDRDSSSVRTGPSSINPAEQPCAMETSSACHHTCAPCEDHIPVVVTNIENECVKRLSTVILSGDVVLMNVELNGPA